MSSLPFLSGLTSADVPMWVFGEKHVKLLTEHLARIQLPGLTSLDQMYLVALADVVASIKQEGIYFFHGTVGARTAKNTD